MLPFRALLVLVVGASAALAGDGPLLQPLLKGPPAQPEQAPPPRIDPSGLKQNVGQLRSEHQAAAAAREAAAQDLAGGAYAAESARLKRRLDELLKKLTQPSPPPLPPREDPVDVLPLPTPPLPAPTPEKHGQAEPPAPAPKPHEDAPPPTPGPQGAVDPLALGQSLFRANDYAGALQALRQVNSAALRPAERVGLNYLMATCLRKLGKTDEAMTLYQQVAGSRADEVLADCARWQLGAMAWRRDLEKQLEEIRQRKQGGEAKP